MFLKLFFLLIFNIFITMPTAYAERLLLIPLDNRPVSNAYVNETMLAIGTELVLPPDSMLPNGRKGADIVSLNKWLVDNIRTVDAAVISADTMIYGGLVNSRKHNFTMQELDTRVSALTDLLNRSATKAYVYSTIMRTPKGPSGRAEPEYYNQYGSQIFKFTALQDKEELVGLTKKERIELVSLKKVIPTDVLDDWQARRDKNVEVNKKLLKAVKENKFNYFVLGKDDTAPYSASHRDARRLANTVASVPAYKYGHFVGADQLGLLLSLRAHNDYTGKISLVNVVYNRGVAGDTVPSYEDGPVANMVQEHILALGGVPVRTAQRADLVLFVNTPYNGITLESSNSTNIISNKKNAPQYFAKMIQNYLNAGKNIAVADIAYGNGADNALVHQLFKNKLAWRISSYSGWNTASNTTGYALSQGLLASMMSETNKKKMLLIRYTDDWAYQANVRMQIYKETVWPAGINGMDLGQNTRKVSSAVREKLNAFWGKYLENEVTKKIKISLPWDRMFEVYVQVP